MMWICAKAQGLRYLRAVRNAGACRGKANRHMIRELRRALADYAKDGGEMTAEAMAARFGQPEDYARAHIRDMDPVMLMRQMAFGRFVKWTVLIAVVLVILIGLICWRYISYYASLPPVPWPGT